MGYCSDNDDGFSNRRSPGLSSEDGAIGEYLAIKKNETTLCLKMVLESSVRIPNSDRVYLIRNGNGIGR